MTRTDDKMTKNHQHYASLLFALQVGKGGKHSNLEGQNTSEETFLCGFPKLMDHNGGMFFSAWITVKQFNWIPL